MTNLDCVNEVLRSVGISPVSTVETSGASDAAEAWRHLESAEREIQAEGWTYNKRCDVELAPDGSDHILIPAGVFSDRIDSYGSSSHINVVAYGDRLYNVTDNTDEFDESIKVSYTLRFELCAIPEAVQRYICRQAACSMARYMSARGRITPSHDRLEREKDVAKGRAKRAHGLVRDQNLTADTNGVRLIGRPQNGYWQYPGYSRVVI